MTKGGKTVLLGGVNCISTRTYMHINNLENNPSGWTVMGNIEMKNLMEDINLMIQVK